MSKDKKTEKGAKGKKGKGGGAVVSAEIRLSGHPRARHQIRLAKSWAGLAGFALAAWAAWRSGAQPLDAGVRGILWGVSAYFLVWFCAVQVWRHMAIAEVRSAERAYLARKAELEQAARERKAQQAAMAGGTSA